VLVGAGVAREWLGAEVVGVGEVRLSRLRAWVWVLQAQLRGMPTRLGPRVGAGTVVGVIAGTVAGAIVGTVAGAAGARACAKFGLVGVGGLFL